MAASERRVRAGLVVGALGWTIPSAAALTVLVPTVLAELVPDGKVAALAAVTISGSIAALLAAIAIGAFSDLTRSRIGARSPWMIGGAAASATSLLALSAATDVASVVLCWVLFQLSMNAVIAPLKAVIADRIPAHRLGAVSSEYGAATLAGFATGVILGARLIAEPEVGLRLLAAVILVLPLVAVLLFREQSNAQVPRRFSGRWSTLRAMVPPRGAPDFYLALGGRFGVMLGVSMITTFQLYILTDYAGVSTEEAAGIVTVAAVLNLVASIIASLVSGPISDRMGRRRAPVVLASVVIAVATLVPLVFAEGWAMLVFATLAGFGVGIYYAVDVALMTEVLPDRQTHSRDLGILNISNTGAQALGPGASSLLVAIGLGFAPVFVVSMVVVLVGGASTLLIRSVR